MTIGIKTSLSLLVLIVSLNSVLAQEPRSSPLNVATARYKDTYIKIVYSQPMKKGRQIFGELVPFGKVWRTGANEATEITITKDVLINGSALKAGTYSLFTVPGEESWTIIFNADLGLWGSYNYNPKQDTLRVTAPVSASSDVSEAFTIAIEANNEKANIIFSWDRTKVTLPIQFLEPKPKP